MDYIEKDLELIRMASGESTTTTDDKEKKATKTEKIPGRKRGRPPKSETNARSAKVKPKPPRKTLSPKHLKKDKLEQKEKKVRRSLGSISIRKKPGPKPGKTLGKIRLPNPSKKPAATLRKVRLPSPILAKKPAPALGKIRLPPMKRQVPQTTAEMATVQPQPVKNTLPPKVASKLAPLKMKSRRSVDPDAVPIEGIHFEEGAKIEAVDHGLWYRARIVKVDHQKMDILVHFDNWGPKFDTWFPMTSTLIRGRTQQESKPEVTYEAGEDVLARWTDGNFYPATVLSVNSSSSCQVMYFDGMKKLLRPNAIKKMSEKEKETAMQAAQKLLLMLPPEVGSPSSSSSPAGITTGAEFRRYKTSANDRERRIAARSGGGTPTATELGPRKRTRKRKIAATVAEPHTPETQQPMTPESIIIKRKSSGDEAFIAKKARLDKIASNLVNKISPTSEKEKEKTHPQSSTLPVPVSQNLSTPVKSHIVSHDDNIVAKPSNIISPKVSSGPMEAESSDQPIEILDDDDDESPAEKDNVVISSEYTPKNLDEFQAPTPPQKEDPSKSPVLEKSDSRTNTSPISTKTTSYKNGDIVLAKWADCRSYLAYIIKKESDDQYKIRYYDGMVKIVKASFIYPWIGPLPDALKSFKPKDPAARKQRSTSTDLKPAKGRPRKTLSEPKTALQRRRTISVTRTEVSPPPLRRRRQSETKATKSVAQAKFAVGEKVIAKWTDLRWYPASIVSKKDDEHYEVRYHDKMTRIVRDTWLNQWAPKPPSEDSPSPVKEDQKTTEETPKVDQTKESAVTEPEPVEIEGKIEEPTPRPTADTGNQSVQSKIANRRKFWYLPGSSVLAKFNDGKKYPATIRECLGNKKFIIEFDNGVRSTVGTSVLKPWNPLALPPITKYYRKKLEMPISSASATAVTSPPTSVQAKIKEPLHPKETSGRIWTVKSAKMPRQVVRGYDAYYSGLPSQNVVDVERRLFGCRVPGCTKRFRKEDMLRQHHKLYHQKRYKLRDQKAHPATVRRKSSKDGKERRRVSADYVAISLNNAELTATPTAPTVESIKQPLPSQGQENTPKPQEVTTENSSKVEPTTLASADTPVESAPLPVKEPTVIRSDRKTAKRRRRQPRKRSAEVKQPVKQPVKEEIPVKEPEVATPPEPKPEEPVSSMNEEVIRCSCQSEEEEGVMIQCEGCFTWQHIACIGSNHPERAKHASNGEKSDAVHTAECESRTSLKNVADGEGYVCWVCKNPKNVRKSQKYLYNTDFLTKGRLPSLANIEETSAKIAESSKHSLDPAMLSSVMDEVMKMQEALHGIKQKVNLATSLDESALLKTWEDLGFSNVEKGELSEKDSQKLPSASDQNEIAHHSRKSEDVIEQKTEEEHSSAKHVSLPQKVTKESHEAYILRCKENLLDHIAEMEEQLNDRITRLTDFVSGLQSSSDEDDVKNVHTLQKDLAVVQTLLTKC